MSSHLSVIYIVFLFSFDEYYKLGKWTSENCSDPKNLFESIVSRLEDVIGHTSYEYYDTEKDTIEIETKDLAKEWQAYDNRIYGRYFWNMKTPNSFFITCCFIFPPKSMTYTREK